MDAKTKGNVIEKMSINTTKTIRNLISRSRVMLILACCIGCSMIDDVGSSIVPLVSARGHTYAVGI